MDDNFLAESGGDDVKSSAKWFKDILVDQAADRIEPILSPMRETPPPMTMRRGASSVIACVRAKATARPGAIQDRRGVGIAVAGGLGDEGRGDPVRRRLRISSGRPSRLVPLRSSVGPVSCAAEAIAQPEATCSSSSWQVPEDRAVGHPQVSDLGRTLAGAAVDLIIDDQCAADSAADGHVKER